MITGMFYAHEKNNTKMLFEAIDALASMGEDAINPMGQIITSDRNPSHRKYAIWVLERIPTNFSLAPTTLALCNIVDPWLILAASDQDPSVKDEAIRVLYDFSKIPYIVSPPYGDLENWKKFCKNTQK